MVTEYLPLLARGAALSLCVMLLSLAVALVLGLTNAVIKLFGRAGCVGYRPGTPLSFGVFLSW